MKKIALSLLALSSLVIAEDAKPTEKPLKTHTELGFVQTKGNTDTQTFSLDMNVKKEWVKHVLTFDADAQYATDNDVETKNKYLLEGQYDYKFTERFSFNYLIGYKDDKFSGFTYQLYTGPGAKYKAIKTKTQELSFDGNILYARDRYDAIGTTVPPVAAYTNDYTSYKAKGVYSWQIIDSLKFLQELSLRGSFEESNNYFVNSKTAFTNKISDILSAGLSYKVDYVNLPAVGKKKTDSTLAFNLIIDY